MKVLLVFDKRVLIDSDKFLSVLKKNVSHIEFELYKKDFEIKDSLIRVTTTFKNVNRSIGDITKNFNKIFCFTLKQYEDNFFFYEIGDISIFSFSGWSNLTTLPFSNGALHFVNVYFAQYIDPKFRHYNNTGCIYDFLQDKRGIDSAMRQSGFCSECLTRISKSLRREEKKKIFSDIQQLMNLLSVHSRWNKDVLETIKLISGIVLKRKAKSNEGLKVVIASPGDTGIERNILIESLERKFRINNHEKHCGFRIMVQGWEDLPSQPGYPQDTINEKIIKESDFVIAIFKHKLGTPIKNLATGAIRSESGTAEELLLSLDNAKQDSPIGMVYFFSTAPAPSLDLPNRKEIEREWKRLQDFKKSIKDKVIYKPYVDSNELLTIVMKDLENNIINYITKNN